MSEYWVPGFPHRAALIGFIGAMVAFLGGFAVVGGADTTDDLTLAWVGIGIMVLAELLFILSGIEWIRLGRDPENEAVGTGGVLRGSLVVFLTLVIVNGLIFWAVNIVSGL